MPAAVIRSKKLAGPFASTSATDALPLPFALPIAGGIGMPHSSDCRLPNGMVQSKPTFAPVRAPPSDGSSGTTRKPDATIMSRSAWKRVASAHITSSSSNTSMSSMDSPARASAFSVLGTGPMPITSGSTPAKAKPLIDAGANPDATAEHLVHNAILGSNYCRVVLGVQAPRVGLVTIGTEEGKGNALVAETHELLKRITGVINYVGPVEGFQVFEDHVDVVVCDGFVGNILLKSWESLSQFFRDVLRQEMAANPIRMAGAYLAQGAFGALRSRINPERYGGAPLLGLRGNILKAHGSSNRKAIVSAINRALARG